MVTTIARTLELSLGTGRRTDQFLARVAMGNVGDALSGGGSRACVAGLGQLRALRELGCSSWAP